MRKAGSIPPFLSMPLSRHELGRTSRGRISPRVRQVHRPRLEVNGRTLHSWCAWDTLFLPELIGRPAEVESTCPTTGATVSLRVGPDGPSEVSPPEAALSFIRPGDSFAEETIARFCRFVHFFASPQAAEEWTRRHPGTFVISIEQGFEIGRRSNTAQLGSALAELAA